MRFFLQDEDVLYVDLPGKHASENPSVSFLATSARPGIVPIIITLIELFVPYDSREHLRNARVRKTQKSSYLKLLGDLEAKGYWLHLLPVRFPLLVTLSQSVLKPFMNFFPSVPRFSLRAMFDAAAEIAISASFSIFTARRDLVWPSERPLLT